MGAVKRGLPPILPQDCTVLARLLLIRPGHERDTLCHDVLKAAERAHRYCSETGTVHPRWGNGSLEAATRSLLEMGETLPVEPLWDDEEYLTCLLLVLHHLKATLLRESPATKM